LKQGIKNSQTNYGFSLRGLENTRIESLSDGVFAIAIGMLLISSNPPTTFDELKIFIKDFVPFAGTISVLMWIWYQHYLFFIRFGLRDASTTAINSIVLFLVLFYTYPLKFMFRILVDLYQGLITSNQELLNHLFTETIHPKDTASLMVIYGFGAAAIFFVFVWLNTRALKRKEMIGLSIIEIQLTKNTIFMNLASGVIPMLSATIAFFELAGNYTFMVSGFIYMSYSFVMPLVSYYGRKRLSKLTD
jgi:uncharacterized membrane protein